MEEKIVLREETKEDFSLISSMHIENFHHDLEAKLIEGLRELPTYQSWFSEVLTVDDEVVGHLMMTPVMIVNPKEAVSAMVIGPVSIKMGEQRKGYGKILLSRSLSLMKEKGIETVLVYGGEYYHQFGFSYAETVYRPNPMPGHGILMKALSNENKKRMGVIHYPHPFDPLIHEWDKL